jgi:hypothetical protein
LVRTDHPLVITAVNRRHSATSLTKLLRDPLGYLWTYGFGWREPLETEEPLVLDPLAFGELLHATLEKAVNLLEAIQPGGLGGADESTITDTVRQALDFVSAYWERDRPVPPPVIWRRKLQDIRALAVEALTYREEPLPNQRSWAEIPFGGDERAEGLSTEQRAPLPWDPMKAVVIPGTTIAIAGCIDRLDLSGPGTRVLMLRCF